MKKTIIRILLLIIFLSLIFLLIKKSEAEDRPFNQIELSSNNRFNNGTLPAYYDTILSVAMDYRGLTGYVITLGNLTDGAKSQFDGQLKAHVRYFNSNFYLFTNDMDRKEAIEVLCHEVIHMYQYSSGDLIYNENGVIWKGESIDLNSKEYEERPWENEAFSQQQNLIDLVEKKLYN